MAKNILNTLLTIALKMVAKNGKTATRPVSLKTASASTVKTAAGSAVAGSTGALSKNFEKIKFGPYDWLALERKGDTALIITEGIVYRGPYHSGKKSDEGSFVGATWENCDLRKYLNGKFLEKFSPADIARIIEVTNQNPDNPWFKTPSAVISAPGGIVRDPKGGNPTKDKVFLLSIEEACRYFGDSTARLRNKGFTQSGSGVKAQIKFDHGYKFGDETRISDQNDKNRIAILPAAISPFKTKKDMAFRWWLRSPGEADILAAEVTGQGTIKITGSKTFAFEDRDFGGVRPALWIKV